MHKAVIGAQWGDEGKGKIVDLLCPGYDLVVRYQGGNNAGHTVVAKGRTYKLHLIPSGAVQGKTAVLGNGMVISPEGFFEEAEQLDNPSIIISDRAHVVLFYHQLLDWAKSHARDIGTTGKGIGPTYMQKHQRSGAIRIIDLLHEGTLRRSIEEQVPLVLKTIRDLVPEETLHKRIKEHHPLFYSQDDIIDVQKTFLHYANLGARMRPFVRQTAYFLNDAMQAGKNILFEGAQGAMLDIDHGTFPYVTSSAICRGGVLQGTGTREEFELLGIVKAYTTRVGGGPFVTELTDSAGTHLQDKGHEFGTTTGRPRRCGWIDAFQLSYVQMINGFDSFALMKLDVLSGLQEVKICKGYEQNDSLVTEFPSHTSDLEDMHPLYETLPGWDEDITNVKRYEDLPDNCKAYIERIEELLNVPVSIISVGPDREQTITRKGF